VDVRGSKVESSDVFVETTRPRRITSEGRREVQRGNRRIERVVEKEGGSRSGRVEGKLASGLVRGS
jgi:hypothetical protein